MPGYFTDPESELYKLYLDKKYVNSDSLKNYYTRSQTDSKLSTELEKVSDNIKILKESVESLSGKFSDYALNSELSSVKTTLTALELIVNTLKDNESKYALQEELTPVRLTLTKLSEDVNELSTNSTTYALKSELTTLSNNFTLLSSTIDELSEKYALKSDLSKYQLADNYALEGSSYTKDESDDRFQPVGNYALVGSSYNKEQSDDRFQPAGNYALVGSSYTKNESNDRFQLAGKYALSSDLSNYQAKGDYALSSDLSNYQAKGDYALKTNTLSCDPLTGLCSLPIGNKGYLDVNGGIRTNGNIGIRTTTPTQPLDVNGRVKATSFGLMNSTFTTNGNDIFLNTNGASNIFLRPNGDGNPLNQVVVGPTNTNFNTISATGATIFNLNVTNGFNAPKAFADLYGVNLGANGIVSKGPININTATTNSWTLRQSSDGKLCFALNGTNKICINGNGSIVAPTVAYSA
jgi:hypothetical protein